VIQLFFYRFGVSGDGNWFHRFGRKFSFGGDGLEDNDDGNL
jgi:hypothetical protein